MWEKVARRGQLCVITGLVPVILKEMAGSSPAAMTISCD
jgi:hypothetical protein